MYTTRRDFFHMLKTRACLEVHGPYKQPAKRERLQLFHVNETSLQHPHYNTRKSKYLFGRVIFKAYYA